MKKKNQQKLQLFSKENFRNISLSEKELNELRGGGLDKFNQNAQNAGGGGL
jgi:hypothetical protein